MRRQASVGRTVAWVLLFCAVNAYNAFRWFWGPGAPAGYINVAVIQPNVPQRLKWDAAYSLQIVKKLFAMQQRALQTHPNLVVWPETAIPFYIDERRPFALTQTSDIDLSSWLRVAMSFTAEPP